jgi:hypothetical protein
MKIELSNEQVLQLITANNVLQAFIENPIVNNKNFAVIKAKADDLDNFVGKILEQVCPL